MTITIKEKDNNVSWEQLTDILHDAYSEHKKNGLLYAAAIQAAEKTQTRGEPQNAICYNNFVAFDEKKPIGMISCAIKDGSKWYHGKKYMIFCQFGVLHNYQKFGIGSMLLKAAEEYAVRNQCDTIVMDTSAKAKELIHWYTKKGWDLIDFCSWPTTNYFSVVFCKKINDSFVFSNNKYYFYRKRKLIVKTTQNSKGQQRHYIIIKKRVIRKLKQLLSK